MGWPCVPITRGAHYDATQLLGRAWQISFQPMVMRQRAITRLLSPARRKFSSAAARVEGYEVAAVPTIDVGALQRGEYPPALVEDVAAACADWGFFQVVNHGVTT